MVAALVSVVVVVATVAAAATQDFVVVAGWEYVVVDLVAELVVAAVEPFDRLHWTGDLCSLAALADRLFVVEHLDSQAAVAVAGWQADAESQAAEYSAAAEQAVVAE